jgi:hypothetical protein
MAMRRRGWVVAGGVLGGVALVVALYFASYGECRSDGDCGPKQACMVWTFSSRPWWARGLTYRVCAVPCEQDQDCPGTHACAWSDHGPGPGRHCVPR